MRYINQIIIFILLSSLVFCRAEDRGILSLNGDWEYREGHDHQYLTDPDAHQWKKIKVPVNFRNLQAYKDYAGYITLKKKIPDELNDLPDKPLALKLDQLSDVSKIYINEHEIGSQGSVEPYRSAMFKTFLGSIPASALRRNAPNYIFVVVYSPKETPIFVGGPNLEMGISEKVYEDFYIQEFLSLSFILVYLVVALYHLLLFLKRPGEMEYLLFAATCFFISLYFLNRTEIRNYFFSDALFRTRVELITLYVFMSFQLLFLSWMFLKKVSVFSKLYVSFSVLLSGITMFAPYPVIVNSLSIFHFSFLLYAPYVLYVLIVNTLKRHPDAMKLLLGSAVLILCGANDILAARYIIININITKYGYLLFILGIAGILAGRYSRAFEKSDRLNEELKDKNLELQKAMDLVIDARNALEEKVEERTAELQDVCEKLQKTDKMKSSFFANITHEIKTPLTLIMSPLDRMLEDRTLSDSYGREIQMMRNNSLRLLKLITQILDMVKIDASDASAYPETIILKNYISDIVETFKPYAEIKNLQISFQCRSGLNNFITDVSKLETILMNLLSNAVKFTSEGKIKVLLDQNHGEAVISVTDTGIGISQENQQKIFERFYQADHERNRKHEGAGIGLALSYGLAKILKGGLSVISEPGNGSTFTLTIPSLKNSVVRQHALPDKRYREQYIAELANTAADDKLRFSPEDAPVILIAEDRADMRRHIGEILNEYNIIEAENGNDAYQKIQNSHVDLVISDIMMPEKDGFELMKSMDDNQDLHHIPLIFLSALEDEMTRMRGFFSGAVYYLSKPFSPSELRGIVYSALKRASLAKTMILGERKKLYEDIHDNLGSYITDLIFITDEMQKRELTDGEKKHAKDTVKKISESIRGQLLMFERMILLQNDFSLGLHMMLLDRYSLLDRRIEFNASEEISRVFSKPGNKKVLSELYSVCMEIVTNDLKYGQGKSVWSFRLRQDAENILEIDFHSQSVHPGGVSGFGTGNLESRISRMQGKIKIQAGTEFSLNIQIPFATA